MNTYEELKYRQGWTLEQKIDQSVGVVSTFLAKTNGKGCQVPFLTPSPQVRMADIPHYYPGQAYAPPAVQSLN